MIFWALTYLGLEFFLSLIVNKNLITTLGSDYAPHIVTSWAVPASVSAGSLKIILVGLGLLIIGLLLTLNSIRKP